MPSTFLNGVLVILILAGARVVLAVLNTPRNVRLTSINMNLVLRWDSSAEGTSDLLYTAEAKTSVTMYRVGCVNTSALECDFSSLEFPLSLYGRYTGRVRAQQGPESSPWVESNNITMDIDTIIGSPSVSLFSNGAALVISIEDPVFAISTLKDVYSTATYNITYWKDGQSEKARNISSVLQNRVVLNKLDPWMKYCVQVQINAGERREGNSKFSIPSSTVCESTTSEAEAPWVPAVVTFFIMTLTATLVVIALVYRKRISHLLCPQEALPSHLLETQNSPNDWTMQISDQPEEKYNSVKVIADNKSMEQRKVIGKGAVCLLQDT
ncbi:interleukin-10 receptor subunit beta-like [Dunckerocampus dactyliophorus]|uniref:interleukin-10 receptor subunit beta-like n=1 Tax=Dunckerocampus dactyliophorus TaxID=161453 RepID=UPI0024050F69|nr:interleukin-10 receptor subunit beta-like [Dunckerocampus dactyliophorus]